MSCRVAVFASGRGSNLQALVRASRAPRFPAKVVLAVVDSPDAGAVELARELGLPVEVVPRTPGMRRAEHEGRIAQLLRRYEVEWVCLAGYLRILSPAFLRSQRGRVLNIHPSLLPDLPGLHAIERALELGRSSTGVTVHLVDAGTDTGPVVLQEALSVPPGESLSELASRVHAVEHRLYPRALELAATGHLDELAAAVLSDLPPAPTSSGSGAGDGAPLRPRE